MWLLVLVLVPSTQFNNLVSLMNGSVVIVGVSYRLNAFGFLALRELSLEDPRHTSGNYGMWGG